MPELYLSRIRLYPIKGCGGTDIEKAPLDGRGLRYDRRWMLVNELGLGLQQLDYPQLSRIMVALADDALHIKTPGMPPLHVPLEPQYTFPITVRWYKGNCLALPASRQADIWFSEFLDITCRLVFMPESTQRLVEPEYALNKDLAAFTSFPYHLISESSLEDLNQRLATPVSLERFRPNLIITGAPAFAEDSWNILSINQQRFSIVKGCNRCAIINVDPASGKRTSKEPLSTLARYRTSEQKVYFGQYLIAEKKGLLHVGDSIEIIAYQTQES